MASSLLKVNAARPGDKVPLAGLLVGNPWVDPELDNAGEQRDRAVPRWELPAQLGGAAEPVAAEGGQAGPGWADPELDNAGEACGRAAGRLLSGCRPHCLLRTCAASLRPSRARSQHQEPSLLLQPPSTSGTAPKKSSPPRPQTSDVFDTLCPPAAAIDLWHDTGLVSHLPRALLASNLPRVVPAAAIDFWYDTGLISAATHAALKTECDLKRVGELGGGCVAQAAAGARAAPHRGWLAGWLPAGLAAQRCTPLLTLLILPPFLHALAHHTQRCGAPRARPT